MFQDDLEFKLMCLFNAESDSRKKINAVKTRKNCTY